jgi:hypothetical protein
VNESATWRRGNGSDRRALSVVDCVGSPEKGSDAAGWDAAMAASANTREMGACVWGGGDTASWIEKMEKNEENEVAPTEGEGRRRSAPCGRGRYIAPQDVDIFLLNEEYLHIRNHTVIKGLIQGTLNILFST